MAHLFHARSVVFFLLPLILAFNATPFRFLMVLAASYFLFFQPYNPTSNFFLFSIPDSLVAVFVVLAFFSREKPLVFRLPRSAAFWSLYVFVAYVLILSIHSFGKYGADVYVVRDVKNALYLLLAPMILAGEKEETDLKKVFFVFFSIILLTTCYSTLGLLDFLVGKERFVTWNEIIISDSVIACALFLSGIRLSPKIRRFFGICLIICIAGLIVTQTRGLWLSTSACLLFFYAGMTFKNFSQIKFSSLMRRIVVIGGTAALIYLVFITVFRIRLLDFVVHRLMAFDEHELIDPYSSLGYRLNESFVVWEKASFFGHGPGARVHLFFTQIGFSKFMDWWSIHSGFLDLLHKYGFLGLAIFLFMYSRHFFRCRENFAIPSLPRCAHGDRHQIRASKPSFHIRDLELLDQGKRGGGVDSSNLQHRKTETFRETAPSPRA